MSITGDIVKDYLTRFPNTAALSLAKKIYAENNEAFNSVEHVRTSIRTYKGSMGAKTRQTVKDKRFFKPENLVIPEPFESETPEPYILPVASKRVLYLADVHCPYHSVEPLDIAIKYGQDNKADTVVLNGDFLDFWAISRYEKNPKLRRLKQELEIGREVLVYIRSCFPNALIIYREGNHEMRYEAYLRIKAPELLDVEEFQLEVLMRMRELQIIYIKEKVLLKAGKLNVLHGHEYKGSSFSPVNIARNYVLKAKENILVGHHHQSQEFVQKSIGGRTISGWAQGCLCDLSPGYLPYNEHVHGFAFQEIYDSEGNFHLHNKKIIGGRIC